MATLEERLQGLKRRIEQITSEANKAKGALEVVMGRLDKEFGCKSIEEAEDKLKELTSQADKLSQQFERELRAFEEKYKDRFYDDSTND